MTKENKLSKPKAFKDLKVAELRRSAIEDFAVEVGEKDSAESVIAALFEAGVEWKDYVEQHPEVAPDEPAPVVKETTREEVIPLNPSEVRVQEGVDTAGPQPFLIKMERENPLYQTRGYTFTKENPYCLVRPEDVEYILSKEDGFRQALPSELQEFYG